MARISEQGIRARFGDAPRLLACPVCQQPLRLNDAPPWRLECPEKHRFDIAREGYVHLLLTHQRRSNKAGYAPTMLKARRRLFDAGFYAPLQNAIAHALARFLPEGGRLFDAGCGEGGILRALLQNDPENHWRVLGADLAKEGVRLAAKGPNPACWFVANLNAPLPLQSEILDGVLNIFSPQNAPEFARLLRPGGCLLKVLAGPRHLEEYRNAIFTKPRKEAFDPAQVLADFDSDFTLIHQAALSEARPLTLEMTQSLIAASPLSWKANRQRLHALSQTGLPEVTLDAALFVLQKK